MASQNPFTTFFTYEDRLTLARKIVQGISDFNPAACAKIALTFALNPSLMDDLTMKDSRRIMELAKLCSEVPWNLPESAVLDPEQSAPPTQTLAELRTTDAVPAATAVAAQSAPAPTDVADQSATAPADVAAQSATAPAHVAGQSAIAPADVATRSATTPPDVAVQPLPQATPAAPMPPVSANLPQVRDVAATQPGVHGVHSTVASSDPLFIAPPGSSVSHVDATTIPSTKIGVSSVFFSDKKVLSSGPSTEVDVQFSPDYDLIASSLSNSHYRTWPKRDTKKPGKQGDLESSFLPSSYAILLRMATTNWLPTVTVHSVSKKMAVLLFKIRNNIPFNLGELIFDHIMAFRHGQGKEDKVLLPFSSLIYGILCKQGFRKHPQEEELSPTSVYSIDRRLFFKSHFDDCSTFKSAVVPEGESVSSTRSRVSVDFAAVSARVLTTQSIIKSLKSTVVQMEKVLLEDQMLLQSFETDEMDLDSAR
nr:uncharacterized protein LOC109185001 [Ipomoea batatas]